MAQNYKIRNALKNLPFYTREIKKSKKKNKSFTNNRFLYELPIFPEKDKNFTNYQVSIKFPFFLKNLKAPKD